MKCYQCNKPAMYEIPDEEIPLCLDCYFKFSQINQQQIENMERQLNYLSDYMDSTIGLPPSGPRYPSRPKPVHINGVQMNNISVSNSVVGTINTGSIGRVDQSITVLQQLGDNKTAEAIKVLTESILQSNDLTKNQCNELIEILSVLSKEAATPPDRRENSVAHTLLEKALKITKTASDIAEICEKWWPVLAAVFNQFTEG